MFVFVKPSVRSWLCRRVQRASTTMHVAPATLEGAALGRADTLGGKRVVVLPRNSHPVGCVAASVEVASGDCELACPIIFSGAAAADVLDELMAFADHFDAMTAVALDAVFFEFQRIGLAVAGAADQQAIAPIPLADITNLVFLNDVWIRARATADLDAVAEVGKHTVFLHHIPFTTNVNAIAAIPLAAIADIVVEHLIMIALDVEAMAAILRGIDVGDGIALAFDTDAYTLILSGRPVVHRIIVPHKPEAGGILHGGDVAQKAAVPFY
jgi:hypothetical protein